MGYKRLSHFEKIHRQIRKLNHRRRDPLTWRQIAAVYRISYGAAYRIGESRVEPKDPKIREAIGLPPLVAVAACECGQVHTYKSCRAKTAKKPQRKHTKDLAVMIAFMERAPGPRVWLAGGVDAEHWDGKTKPKRDPRRLSAQP